MCMPCIRELCQRVIIEGIRDARSEGTWIEKARIREEGIQQAGKWGLRRWGWVGLQLEVEVRL